ncbi:ParB/RepB/Spo0J family partition protein [Williamsia sterculiae]|uniref:Chromosome partitioning protein, ParB family n=1 Tax=Williamsia sterculiae TaxID=1344003 RepID=A0A1N7HE60_9NOCA|nr:ParB N-terminal domain-containing protein [Williamsia sterculiae]SIS23122.1 chromosome partitioning protein, ParB family [Williamsia sterculiae]
MGNNRNTAAATAVEAGELLHLNPADLVIDTNVRTDDTVPRPFAASVKTHGVRLPVLAVRDETGTVRVRDGQLRTLAAREADLATIPVYVVADAATGDQATIARITDQLVTNEHRTDLHDLERACGAQQLLDLGLSRTKVGQITRLRSTHAVDNAAATARSATATRVVVDAGLSLDQGAVVARYEDEGDTEAVDKLVEAARKGMFDHAAAYLARTDGQRRTVRTAVAELTEQGYQVADHHPGYTGEWTDLANLYRMKTGEPVADTDHDSLTRHYLLAVVDAEAHTMWVDADGNAFDEGGVDWDLADEADQETTPAEGLADPRKLTETEQWTAYVTFYHHNPAVDALETMFARTRRLSGDQDDSTDTADVTSAADRAEQAARAEAEQAEVDRVERKRVKVLNRAGLAAQEVRRAKLREAFTRKTLPKGTAVIMARLHAATMWRNSDLYSSGRVDYVTRDIAAELLGADPVEQITDAAPERAQVILAAITCAAYESTLPKDAWRGAGMVYDGGALDRARATYLRTLVEVFGYTLSEVEEVITGDRTGDSIDLDA